MMWFSSMATRSALMPSCSTSSASVRWPSKLRSSPLIRSFIRNIVGVSRYPEAENYFERKNRIVRETIQTVSSLHERYDNQSTDEQWQPGTALAGGDRPGREPGRYLRLRRDLDGCVLPAVVPVAAAAARAREVLLAAGRGGARRIPRLPALPAPRS